MSQSEDLSSTYHSQKGKNVKNHIESDQSTSYEVFRNNTTAVEVIVKEVPGNKKKMEKPVHQDIKLRRHVQEDVDKLKNELSTTTNVLEQSRKYFQVCLREMQKQIDVANQREIDLQTKYLNLKLENEKLKTCLTSKTNLVKKLAKELNILKHIIKSVVKSMTNIPSAVNNVSCSSDPEYEDFEDNMKRELKFPRCEESVTFDATMLKEARNIFDKRLYE